MKPTIREGDQDPLDATSLAVSSRIIQHWQDEAARTMDARYTSWTFFDTCCLSELVKLCERGESEKVHTFVHGRDIIIPTTVLQELRRAPMIASRIPAALSTGRVWLLPHPTKFWDNDIWNFFNVLHIKRNILEVSLLPAEVFTQLNAHKALTESFERAELAAGQRFLHQIERDRAFAIDERELTTLAWKKINELSLRSYNIEVPAADCRPENFPSLFTYYYAYFFRYLVHQHVKPSPNDFIDLAHSGIAPYCSEFYAEQKLVQSLRQQVQGRSAPTPYATAKLFHARNRIDAASHANARNSSDMRRETKPMLMNTALVTLAEMRRAITAR